MSEEGDVRLLVSRAVNSDPDAWEEIYRRSRGRLYSYARRRTSSVHSAEDAVSETMARAMEQIGRFSQLSPSEQEVLELRGVAELTSDGAAEALGKKPGAVRMAQVRALDKLRNFIAEVDRGD